MERARLEELANAIQQVVVEDPTTPDDVAELDRARVAAAESWSPSPADRALDEATRRALGIEGGGP